MTIKIKITLWYSLFMTLLVGLSLSLLLYFSASTMFANTEQKLKNTVNRSFKEISFSWGVLTYDPDFHLMGLEKGIYLSVYDVNGNFLYGDLPGYYNGSAYLTADCLQEEYDFYTNWKIYDNIFSLEGYGSIWIRGMTSQTSKEGWMQILLQSCIFLFPFFIIIVSVLGYQIIKHTLAPLDKLNRLSSEISTGSDLSKRTNLTAKNDEIHRLAQTFDHMMERLEQSFIREQSFTSDVSHELRTPISVIHSECEYALMPDSTEEEKKEALESILNQAHHMTSLTTQLLHLARLEQGKQPIQREDLCLCKLIRFVLESLKDFSDKKNIRIHLDLPKLLTYQADKNMMIRLFTNLIDNAIRYGKDGGNIWISLSQYSEEITVIIKDDGIGIASDDIGKMFKRFSQGTKNRRSASTGLGLYLSKQIIEAHGGEIGVNSKIGEGSEFYFKLGDIK